MVLLATLCDAPHLQSLIKGKNASVYSLRLHLTILQINLYHYWAETQLKRSSAPRPCLSNTVKSLYLFVSKAKDSIIRNI